MGRARDRRGGKQEKRGLYTVGQREVGTGTEKLEKGKGGEEGRSSRNDEMEQAGRENGRGEREKSWLGNE